MTLARVLIGLYLLAPAALTLAPDRPDAGSERFAAAVDSVARTLTFGAVEVSRFELEVLANVLMLVPLGLLLPFAAPRLPLSLLLLGATLLSLAFETAQYLLLPGRVATLVDVLANAGGAAMGLVVAADTRRGLARLSARRSARRSSRVRVSASADEAGPPGRR